MKIRINKKVDLRQFNWLGSFSYLIIVGLVLFPVSSWAVVKSVQSVRIVLPSNVGQIGKHASDILAREIAERSGAKINIKGKSGLTIELVVKSGIGTEGFKITDTGKYKISITGNDENGLLYGIGKLLHTSGYNQSGFTASTWRGIEVPDGEMRGIYFATHFNNWYEAASDEERLQYLESMALWGTNALVIHFPNQWLTGYDDPKAIEWIRKMKILLKDAKSVGMQVGLLPVVNGGFTSSPKEFYATQGHNCGGGLLLCPSKPEAKKLIIDNWKQLLNEFTPVGLDFIVYWPYDEGGCDCKDCAPWGANGYLKMCSEHTRVTREKFPKAKFVLSTWMFDVGKNDDQGRIRIDYKADGEYAGLAKSLAKDKSWVDYIMTDAHEGFPEYPLKNGTAGNLPMINFPEISMIGQYPWGGFGANPLPKRLQGLWNEAKGQLRGGFPYSEGIYEDIDKAICSQLYWNPNQSTEETVKEYIAYEYSPAVVDSVWKAIELLEQNHMRKLVVDKNINSGSGFLYGVTLGGSRIEFQHTDRTPLTPADKEKLKQTSEEAYNLIVQADKQLTPQAKSGWRWRILYLRAVIDKELAMTDGWLEGAELKAAYEELTRITHNEKAGIMVHVPRIDDAKAKYSGQSNK